MTYYWTIANLDRYHYFDSYEKLPTIISTRAVAIYVLRHRVANHHVFIFYLSYTNPLNIKDV